MRHLNYCVLYQSDKFWFSFLNNTLRETRMEMVIELEGEGAQYLEEIFHFEKTAVSSFWSNYDSDEKFVRPIFSMQMSTDFIFKIV